MDACWLTLLPRRSGTGLLLMQGQDELLRAWMPPLERAPHEQSVTRLLEGLSLWLDTRLCVALSAGGEAHTFRLSLLDELGAGAQSIFYAVHPVRRGGHRGRRLRGVGDFTEARQLWLQALTGGVS